MIKQERNKKTNENAITLPEQYFVRNYLCDTCLRAAFKNGSVGSD